MRKIILVISLLIILSLSFAAISRADSLSYLGFALGDSINTCATRLYQLERNGQIRSHRVISENQVAADLKIGGSPATLILSFSDGYLSSVIVASYTSTSLSRVVQQIIDEYERLVIKFGNPTYFNQEIDNNMVNSQQFTDIAAWEFDNGEELLIGIYNNNRTYSMFMIIQVTTRSSEMAS